MSRLPATLLVLLLGAMLLTGLRIEGGAAPPGREYLLRHGPGETGAVNLVTSIYLGYRAFDTLGETIVLMMAVAGVVWLMGRRE